jgi:hypothetical protein
MNYPRNPEPFNVILIGHSRPEDLTITAPMGRDIRMHTTLTAIEMSGIRYERDTLRTINEMQRKQIETLKARIAQLTQPAPNDNNAGTTRPV